MSSAWEFGQWMRLCPLAPSPLSFGFRDNLNAKSCLLSTFSLSLAKTLDLCGMLSIKHDHLGVCDNSGFSCTK